MNKLALRFVICMLIAATQKIIKCVRGFDQDETHLSDEQLSPQALLTKEPFENGLKIKLTSMPGGSHQQ